MEEHGNIVFFLLILLSNCVPLFSLFSVMHDLRLIHTDLKPENILLVSPEYVKVPDYKVISNFFCCLVMPL